MVYKRLLERAWGLGVTAITRPVRASDIRFAQCKPLKHARRNNMKTAFDISKSPMVVIWEMNRTGELPEVPRLNQAQAQVDPLELTSLEAERLLADVAELRPPVFVFAGADPLRRKDIYELVNCAAHHDLHPVLAAGASSHLDRNAIAELKHAGLWRLQLTLDGSTQIVHEMAGKGAPFFATLEALQWANEWRLPVQINTNLSTRNIDNLESLAALLRTYRVLLWNITFPVPTNVREANNLPSAGEFEAAFARLHTIAQQVPFKIKTTEAQHYRRFVLQQRVTARSDKSLQTPDSSEGIPGIMPVNEARATVFISHAGEIYPGACLPVSAGNVRFQKLADVYRSSEIFEELRNVSRLTGKCGSCNFKEICGGSRARALAALGDMFTEDVSCIYRPGSNSQVRNRPQPPRRTEGAAAKHSGQQAPSAAGVAR
jgi:radical SAM protein with 4Fe4S-binding SPASM domain